MKYAVRSCLFVFLLALFALSCSPLGLRAQKQLSPQKLQSDFDYLVTELKAQHKGLYLHNEPRIVDAQLDSLRRTLTVPMDRVGFLKTVYAAIALTNEGHTWAALPKLYQAKIGLKKDFLPLSIRFKDRKAIVRQYFGQPVPGLVAGMEIVSINGMPMTEIVRRIQPYIPTDGFNQTSAYEWLGQQFYLLYRLIIGPQVSFELKMKENGKSELQNFVLEPVKYTRINNKNAQLELPKLKHERLKYELLNDSVAYLAVNSFSISPEEYGPWLKGRFEQIKVDGVKHLILDIQANGGGTEGNENLLMSYLNEEPFQKYAFVSMATKPYLKHQKSKSMIMDEWRLVGDEAQRGDYTLQSNYFSELGYENPDPQLCYAGKLYVLISGLTFSGGAEFASMIKLTERGVLLGEETGGAYEGNVSGYAESIKLPYSKIKVSIPIVHFRINAFPKVKSRGVMPDYKAVQSPEDYLIGINSKLEYALQLTVREDLLNQNRLDK